MTRITSAAVVVSLFLTASRANAQGPPATGFGALCQPGQFSHGGYLLVCSSAGTFRYALPEDIPPPPSGGYQQRPPWYPQISEMFRASKPPACPLLGRVT